MGISMALNTFVDTSLGAYGVAVYGVRDGKVTLFMAKESCAPAETLSVPMLELTADVLGARLPKHMRDAYEQEVVIVAEYV